ncbi:porin [Thauera sp. JM12B12]|uniref:porin n=1 Tax=Thauera sp. JM12B12 TaxID=3142262 RepID=UPI0031F3458C
MQKKLIALAVAGLVSAPAFAQSNVTIYGVADAYMAFGDHGANDYSAVNSGGLSGSRIGFRGTEDLGNGLKGVFTYEQGIAIDDAATGMGGAARQAFVGLSSGFGTVSLGRQYAPGFDHIVDAFGNSAILSPAAILVSGEGSTIDAGSGARWNNSVAYNGSFSGLGVRAIYSMDAVEQAANPSDDDAYGLGLNYMNGPLRVAAIYQVVQDNAEDQKEWSLGASYNFGVATLTAHYQDAKSLGNAAGDDLDLWQVGVMVPVGAAGTVHLGYGQADYDLVNAEAKSYSIAYTHALSKRTTAYVGYNQTDNDNGLTKGVVGASAGVTGDKANVFAVGMRHTF